jgi:transposase
LNSNPEVDVWSLDEVHFQQYGSRCRMWVPPEDKDPVLRHHPGRKSIGYFGAVRLGDGMFVYSRENLQFNGQTFWDFMKLLRQRSRRKGKCVVIIIDNAKYHHAKMHKPWRDKRHVKGFTLDYLPPYSPDLNPIERVWKLTRRLCLHDQYFPTLQSISAAVEKQFDQWEKGTETLRKLCAL